MERRGSITTSSLGTISVSFYTPLFSLHRLIKKKTRAVLLSAFSPPKEATYHERPQQPVAHKSYRVSTRTELDDLLKSEVFHSGTCIQLVEIMMPRGDVPRTLGVQAMLVRVFLLSYLSLWRTRD